MNPKPETEKIKLLYEIGALKDALEDLEHLDEVLGDLLDIPYARFAETDLTWFENDFKDLLSEIDEIADMIDEMPDDVREYLETIQDKLPKVMEQIRRRIRELEKQLGNEGGEP